MSLEGRTAGASAAPLLGASPTPPTATTNSSATASSTHPASSAARPRSSASDWLTARNALIVAGSLAGVGLLYYGYRRYTTTPTPAAPSTRPTEPASSAVEPQLPATAASYLATVAPPSAPLPLAAETPANATPVQLAPSSRVLGASPTLFPPASPAAKVSVSPAPAAPAYSPAQAVAALLAETHDDVKHDTGIDLDSAAAGLVDAEERQRSAAESSRWDEAAEIARRLKEESMQDEKQPVVPYEPWRPPPPLPHHHHHKTVAHVYHHAPHTADTTPLLTPPSATAVAAEHPVDGRPDATASLTVPVPVAQPVSAEQQSAPATVLMPTAAPVAQPLHPVQHSALAVQPSAYLVPSPLRSIHPTTILLSSPSLPPILIHSPMQTAIPFGPLPPSAASSAAALSLLAPLAADTAWLYSAAASAAFLANPAADANTSLIPAPSPAATPALGPNMYSALPSYSTLAFNSPYTAHNQPILAFITDPNYMLAASASSPTSTPLTALTAAATSTASQMAAGSSSHMSELVSRSTLLVELLCVLVLFIGVLATAVDARYLVPLTPITFYVMYVCVQAVRSNGGHTVLFPSSLFSALLHSSEVATTSSSSSAPIHQLLPRALFPVRRDVASLPPSAHLSPVSSAESTLSALSPSSARSPSSAPAVPRQSSEVDDAMRPPSPASFSLPAQTLSPGTLQLSSSALSKPAPHVDEPHTPIRSGRRGERRESKEEREQRDDELGAGYEEKDDEQRESLDSPSRGKRVTFLSERRRGLVESDSSEKARDEEKSQRSVPLNAGSRSARSQPENDATASRSKHSSGTVTTNQETLSAAETTDDDELSSAASSSPPSPTQSTSSTSSSSTPSPLDRELRFFPPEPAIDIAGASSSTLTVRFTYRHPWEDCVQAFWDVSQPDWEQTGHSLGLATSRPSPVLPFTPSAASSAAAGILPSPSFRRESSAATAVDIEYAVVEWWHGASPSSLFIRRQLHVHTKVPAVVKKAVGASSTKRLTLDEHAQLDVEARTFRLQCSNARFRKAILIHDTRTFAPHPEHPDEWSVLSCRFRLCVLPSCGLLKQTVHGWVSGVWKGKQQEVGQRIGRRLERCREVRTAEERERSLSVELGSESGDGVETRSDVSVESGHERLHS